jgi:hypothetical protein
MPVFGIASVLIQVGLIIHVVRTGRNMIWIWVLMVPMVGPIAYIAAELLPELLRGRTARRAASTVQKTLDPTRGLRQAHKNVRLTGSIDARRRFADELFAAGKYGEAIDNYRAALTGLYEHDPHLMLGLARAQFANDDQAAARTTLDELIEKNPEFKSPEGHLLYARALEAEGNLAKAASEYEALAQYYGGAEARYRQAMLFKRMGDKHQAREILQKLLDDAELTTKHSRQLQKQWLDLAKKELGN